MTTYNPTYAPIHTRLPIFLVGAMRKKMPESPVCLWFILAIANTTWDYYAGEASNTTSPLNTPFIFQEFHLDGLPCSYHWSRWVLTLSNLCRQSSYWLIWSLQASGAGYTTMWHTKTQEPWFLVDNATEWTYACVSDVLLSIGQHKYGNSKLANIVPHEGPKDGGDR